MQSAIAETEPLSSISLPNSAPSRNSGKNCARNCAALPMKVCVQCASSGSPAKAAAISAAAGASSSTLQPRKASQTSSAEAEQDAEQAPCLRRRPAGDRCRAVDRWPRSVAVRRRGRPPRRGGPRRAACVRNVPFGVELRGVAELDHHRRCAMRWTRMSRPVRALAVAGSATWRSSAIMRSSFSSDRVERDLVQAVEDVAGRARRAGALDRIDLHEDGVVRHRIRAPAASWSDCRSSRRPNRPRRRSRPPGTSSAGRPRRAARPASARRCGTRAPRPVRTLVAVTNSLIGAVGETREVDALGQDLRAADWRPPD